MFVLEIGISQAAISHHGAKSVPGMMTGTRLNSYSPDTVVHLSSKQKDCCKVCQDCRKLTGKQQTLQESGAILPVVRSMTSRAQNSSNLRFSEMRLQTFVESAIDEEGLSGHV